MKQKEKSKILANACYLCGGKFSAYIRRMIESGYIEKYLGIDINPFYNKKEMRFLGYNGVIYGLPFRKEVQKK